MNSSPQNSNNAGTQRRTGIDNSDEEEWSGVVECVISDLLFLLCVSDVFSSGVEYAETEINSHFAFFSFDINLLFISDNADFIKFIEILIFFFLILQRIL